MTEHLPECERWYANMPEPDECPACEMFRACEQRTLDTARSAVYDRMMAWGYGQHMVDDVLDAIDALREEPMATGGMYSGPPVTLGDGCVIPKSGNTALRKKP